MESIPAELILRVPGCESGDPPLSMRPLAGGGGVNSVWRVVAGAGYLNELPIQRYFRDARLYPITEGTTEIQLRTIARIAGFS